LGPLPKTKNGNVYVLVLLDHFTKWAEAFPIPNQKAQTIARILVEEYICRYGCPERLLSDLGTNFMSNLAKEIIHRQMD